jgi:hypothetical protein
MIDGAYVNVLDYGADPTGVADSTAAIQAAIAAATPTLPGNPWDLNGTAGGSVFIPKGKYKITATIFIPAWVNIKGAGKSATQLVASGNPGVVVSMGRPGLASANDPAQSFHCSLSGLTIFGSSLNTTGLAIYASFWMMFDVEVTKCNYDGIYLQTSYTGKAYNVYSFYNASTAGYAGIRMYGVSAGIGANDIVFIGGSIGNCYDSVRIEQCNGAFFYGMSIQSSKRMGFNLLGGAVGVTIRDCYFESNAEQIAGSTIYGSLSFVLIDNNYFAAFGIYETKYIAGSGFNGAKITNNLFGSSGGGSYIIGLVNEAASTCTFIRNLILGNSGENDSVPLFSTALKVFADAALYPNNAVSLSRVDHLSQYQIQSNFVSVYTVTMTPNTSGTITLEPTQNTGGYSKTGQVVHVQGSVTVASVSSPVGTNVLISLPYPIADLDEDGERIGGVVIQSTANILPFVGNATISGVYMIINASTVAAAQTYSWSFSYITTSGTP